MAAELVSTLHAHLVPFEFEAREISVTEITQVCLPHRRANLILSTLPDCVLLTIAQAIYIDEDLLSCRGCALLAVSDAQSPLTWYKYDKSQSMTPCVRGLRCRYRVLNLRELRFKRSHGLYLMTIFRRERLPICRCRTSNCETSSSDQ